MRATPVSRPVVRSVAPWVRRERGPGLLLAAALALFLTTLVPATAAQDRGRDDDPAREASREELEQLDARLEALHDHVRADGAEDAQAVVIIDQLGAAWLTADEKRRKAIVKQLEAAAVAKRRSGKDEPPDDALARAAARALGGMGEAAVKPLTKLLDLPTRKDHVELRALTAKQLGRTADKKAVGPLVKLLQDKEPALQAAAAEGLGFFDDAPQKLRKEIFEDVLKASLALESAGPGGRFDEDHVRRQFETFWPEARKTLSALSGEPNALPVPSEWQAWWNEHKKSDWDDGR